MTYLYTTSHNTYTTHHGGSHHTDKRSQIIEDFIQLNDFILLNNGKETHFNSYSENLSTIDLISSSKINPHILYSGMSYLLYLVVITSF